MTSSRTPTHEADRADRMVPGGEFEVQPKTNSRRLTMLTWIAAVVALLMLGLMLVPVDVWRPPKNDAVYKGFDANLISTNPVGYPLPQRGSVELLPESIDLSALPNSLPSFHLLTGRVTVFKAAMDVMIRKAPSGTVPLRLGVWSPRSKSGYFVSFGSGPTLATTEVVRNGGAAQTLVGGQIVSQELGSYSPDQTYRLQLGLDKKLGVLQVRVSGWEAPPSSHPMLAIKGGPALPDYADVAAQPVQVVGGKTYRFGGLLKVASGSQAYKLVLGWLDKKKNFIGSVGDWHDLAALSGWTPKELTAKAPAKAAYAQLYLGSGNETTVLFSDLFVRSDAGNGANLLLNGQLLEGERGWSVVRKPSAKPEVLAPHPVVYESRLTAKEAPELFHSVNLSLTVSASSPLPATTNAVLTNYSLTLPHEPYLAVKVDDAKATALLVSLLALGGLLVITRATIGLLDSVRRRRRRTDSTNGPGQNRVVPRAILVGVLLGIVVVIPNLLLFGVGREPYDMASQKIWAYVAAGYGPAQIYFVPNIVSTSHVWGGAPYGAAAFAYEPILAYFFTAIGWAQRLFLSGPGGPVGDTFALEFLIKMVNLLFGLADGLLIYLILRQIRVGRLWSLTGASFFVLNPAVWFSMSVLGLTQVISVFFALLSVWLAERKHPVAAWLALAATSLARPQMLVIALLLGLVFLRKFSWRENLRGAAWAVIFTFLLLGPFTLQTSPSLPVDVLANTLFVQEGGGNEVESTTVSLSAYSVWPMVTYIVDGQSGLARIFHPSGDQLVGPLSYQRVSLLLTAGLVLVLGWLIAFRRKQLTSDAYLPALAAGMSGFLIFMTGIGATHFILGLPFLILSSRWLRRIPYLFIVLVWTITALVPMYGSLAGYLAVFQHGTNGVSRFFADLYVWDSFISAATIANTLVVLICLAATARALTARAPAPQKSPETQKAKAALSVT